MKKLHVLSLVVGFLLIIGPAITEANTTIINDDFTGSSVNTSLWKIPTWVSSSDGTFIGRTQFRVTQNSSLPTVSGSNVYIPVQTYNPTGSSFYGTELISNQSLTLGPGIIVTIKAKMDKVAPGTVGGIFLYALKPGSNTLHDEIDFELVSNLPNQVQTNIYGNEPLGAGHPQFVNYPTGGISDYHTYEIKWLSGQVSWSIDGTVVRTTTSNIPTGPMDIYFNNWVPDSGWIIAYNSAIQPTTVASSNVVLNSMLVDSIVVQSLFTPPAPTATLTANGSHSITVYPGDTVNYAWSSTNADKFSSNYTSSPTSCGSGPWNLTTANGTQSGSITSAAIGCTYTMNYNANQSSTGINANDSVTIIVGTPNLPSPTASLTANGSHSITVYPGDTVTYAWSSTNADKFSSNFTSTPASCGSGPWNLTTANGTQFGPITSASVGCTYTMNYTATQSASAKSVTDSVTILVKALALPAPTATLTANGSHSITVYPGDTVTYVWSSTNADKFSSNFTSTPTSCGSGAWNLTTANGTQSGPITSASIGCTYTMNYTAKQSATSASATDSITIIVKALSLPAPTATLTANGSHSITVYPGDTVNYSWSSTNADKFSSNFTSTPASCGSGPWNLNSASGSQSGQIKLVALTQ